MIPFLFWFKILSGQIEKKVKELVEEQLLQQELYEKEQKKKQGMINLIFKPENNLYFFLFFVAQKRKALKMKIVAKHPLVSFVLKKPKIFRHGCFWQR